LDRGDPPSGRRNRERRGRSRGLVRDAATPPEARPFSKILRDHPSAALELVEARDWYDQTEPGLGYELVVDVDATLAAIAEGRLPTLSHPGIPGVRRVSLKRFPYWLVLLERRDEIVLVAVAHMKRRPGYWRTRVGSRQ